MELKIYFAADSLGECVSFVYMDNFVVSARKYRPTIFEHVVGQSHITTTLKNAIRNRQLAQAFLFCGPRGVGKTTCARILAKTINCEQVTTDIAPCNTCVACNNFNSNRSFNVYELDAASNNSVEDIRALVAQVRYPPQAGSYKVYIIDEVHMLSNAAFNAFLKTLEEPPHYAIFILATTEKQKIIPTILSRCQIFDFHRIQPQAILQQLKHVAQQENVAYEEEALHLISQKVDGALRDALSIFDLLVTFSSGQSITLKATREHLHILDHTYYFRIIDACLQRKPGSALLIYDEILKKGFDGQYFITGLGEHLRNIMISCDPAALTLLTVSEKVKAQYGMQAAQIDSDFLYKALHIINQCDLHYKTTHNKRLHVEMALIALTHTQLPDSSTGDNMVPNTAQPNNALSTRSASKVTASPPDKQPQNNHNIAHATPPVSVTDQELNTSKTTIKLPQIDQLKESLNQQSSSVSLTHPPQVTTFPKNVSLEIIHKPWQTYIQQLKLAGKMSEYSLLNQPFTLVDKTIFVKLVNVVQQDILAGIKEDLIAYLRASLQCPMLELKGILATSTQATKPYTAQEKFTYLMGKYPNLCLLQEKLALEVQD